MENENEKDKEDKEHSKGNLNKNCNPFPSKIVCPFFVSLKGWFCVSLSLGIFALKALPLHSILVHIFVKGVFVFLLSR